MADASESQGSGASPSDSPRAVTAEGPSIDITGWASGGEGVGRLPDGRVVFVEGAVPGDRLVLADLSIGKKLARARIAEIVRPSADRTEPLCVHFGDCGGCRWQHVRYPAQLEAKRTIVRDALQRIGGLAFEGDIEIEASPSPYHYRSRARLVEVEGGLGYRARASNRTLRVEICPVLRPAVQAALGGFDPQKAAGQVSSARSKTGTVEWSITAGSQGPAITHALRNRRGASSGRGRRAGGRRRTAPLDSVVLEVSGERIRASATSFVQGNALLWDAFAEAVCAECLAPGPGTAPQSFVELYAGIGFLTLPLTRRGLSGIAIESEPSAVTDLRFNLQSSGLAQQVEVVAERVESWFAGAESAERLARADLLLLDPPRIGIDPAVCRAIAASGPARLVYVSCDPATWARDVRVLNEAGYRLAAVRAFDLFPQTPHVELLTRLER